MKENRNEWGETKCIICRLCARVCVWLHLKFFLSCCTKWYNTHHKQALPVRNYVNLLDEGTHLLLPVLPFFHTVDRIVFLKKKSEYNTSYVKKFNNLQKSLIKCKLWNKMVLVKPYTSCASM